MADDLGISLSLEEKEIRTEFDVAMGRVEFRERCRELWPRLGEARWKWAIHKKRTIMSVRFFGPAGAVASCLLQDLDKPRWYTKLEGQTQAAFIGAEARCDVLIDTDLCQQSGGGCPHYLAVYVREQDNTTPEGILGLEELQERAGSPPSVQ